MQVDDIPLDDSATFALLGRGDTVGVFQVESGGMVGILRRLKPESLYELAVVLALFRPGVIDMGGVDLYLERQREARAEAANKRG